MPVMVQAEAFGTHSCPDRYVILGGHRDSWVFGGIDPTTGTAVLQEIAQSFGKLMNRGN